MNCLATALRLTAVVICLFGSFFPLNRSFAEEENNQAQKYHSALQRRPEPGYLFDRFYNTWLDQSTTESLQGFLQKQVDQADTTANRLLLAFFYSKQNNDIAAIEEYGKALKNDPASAEAWYYRAQAESRTLDFDTAIADLKRARDLKPSVKLAMSVERQLGTMLLRNHQPKEAIGVWKALLTANPDDEELCEDIVELYIEESLFPEAAAQLEELISRTKDPYTAVMRRLRQGDVQYRSGNRTKAIEIYSATLSESGQNSWLERNILAQIEQIFRSEDDLSGLKKQYAALIEKYPKRIDLQRRRCRLLADLGEQDEAVKGYRAILELMPGDRNNREEYVELLSRIGKHESAVKELEALCRQFPKDVELQVRLAKTLNQAKQAEKAVEAVRQYLKIADQSEYTYMRAARLVESFGDKENAKEFMKKLVETFPDSPSAQEAYAAFLYSNGQKENALAIWEKMMQTADVNHALGIARALETRGEDALVLKLLDSRQNDFGNDPLFLGQLVNVAIRLKQYQQAIPWAKQRVELSKTAMDLEGAVSQIVTACRQSEETEKLISELKDSSRRPIQLTCLLAELLESSGDSKEAEKLLQLPAEKGDLLAIGQQIRRFSLRGEWAPAAEATRRLFDLSGGRQTQYVRRLVELYERDNQIEEALKWVETWKRLSPGATMPWLAEVRILRLQGGKESELLSALHKAIQRFEEDEELRVRLAETYQEAGKLRDAERVFWQLYEKTNDVGGKLRWAVELAKIARQEGTIPKLVEDFKERMKNNRQSIVPQLALAEIYRIADDYDNRRQALMAATKLKPDDLQLLTQIARLEEGEGDWKGAISTLEQAAKLDKTDQTRHKIARLHLEYGNRDTGFAMLRELLGEQISDARVLERMADSLCGMQEWERVVELLQNRISDHAGDYRLRYLLGTAYEELGKSSDASEQFLQMLDVKEELAGIKTNAAQLASSRAGYFGLLQGLLPDEALEWIELQQYQYTAYSYRQNRGMSYSALNASGMANTTISLPPAVDMARPYAMAHLLSLAQGFEESQKAELAAKMTAHGIRNPKSWIKLGIERNNGQYQFAEALEDDPDNESLLAIYVFSGLQQQRPGSAEDLKRAFNKFREKRPQLAIMAAIQAASAEAVNAPLVDDAIALSAKIDSPNPLVVLNLANLLGGISGRPNTGESVLDKDCRNKITKLLVDWYPRMSTDNNVYGPYAFICVVGALRASDNPEAYFKMLDDEVVNWRKNLGKQNAQNQNMFYSRQPNASLFEPKGFPPQELTNFPPNVLGLLVQSNNNRYGGIIDNESDANWDIEKIKPLISKIKDPTLRVLLAKRHEAPDIVETSIKELLAIKPPKLDAYLLAAGKASEDSHYDEAVKLLEKARLLPMKQEMRRNIDAELVSSVIAAKDNTKSELGEDLLKTGRDAALRLRRQRLDPQQRVQLIDMLEVLGLKDEAKKLDKQTNIAAANAPSYSAGAAAYSAPTPSDRLDKVLKAGKRDEAVRLLVADVKSLGQQQKNNPQNMQYYAYQMRELKQKIAGHGLTDDILKQFTPGEGNNPVRLSECAMACELFDRHDEAKKYYERILAMRSKDDLARVRLILLLLATKDGSDALDGQLSQLGSTGGNLLGQMLYGGVNNSEISLDERLRYAEVAILFLAKQKKDRRADLQWATQFVQLFGRQQYVNRLQMSLPSIYQSKNKNNNQRTVDTLILERRVKLHRDFCMQMIDIPELGRTGFQHLLAATEARSNELQETEKTGAGSPYKSNEVQEKSAKTNQTDANILPKDTRELFLQYAEKVLLAEANPKPQSGINRTINYSQRDSSEIRFRNPEEYLAYNAWKTSDWKYIDDKLIPKLNEGNNRKIGKSLESMAKLYRCSQEEFLTVAKQVIKESTAQAQPQNDGLDVIVDVWADRALDVDLHPMVLDAVRRSLKNMNSMQSPFPMRFPETLIAQGKTKQAEAVLDELAAIYLGPAEKRAEYIKKHWQQNSYSSGTPNAQIHTYVNLMQQLVQQEELVFLVMEQIDPLTDILQNRGISYQCTESLRRLMQKQPEEVIKILESSPWLANFDQFSVLPFGQRVGEWPLVQLLQNQNIVSDSKMEPVWSALEKNQQANPTFGRGLFLAVHEQQKKKTALKNFIKDNLENIKKLNARQQSDLSTIIKLLIQPDLLKSDDADAQLVRQWLEQSLADKSSQLLEKYRNAKRIEDLGISGDSPWELAQYLAGVLPAVIREDSQAGVKIFMRTITLAEDAQKRTGSQVYYGDDQTLATNVLDNTLQQSNNSERDPKILLFLIDVLESPEGLKIGLGNSSPYMINNIMQEWQRKVADNKTSNLKNTECFYNELGDNLGQRSCALLIPGLFSTIFANNSNDEKQLVDWAKQEMAKGKYPALAADLFACGRLSQEKKQRNTNKTKSGDATTTRYEPADYHEHFQKIINKDDSPLPARLSVASFVIEQEGAQRIPLGLASDVVKLYITALEKEAAIHSSQHRHFMQTMFSVHKDPACKELLEKWRELFARRYLAPVPRNIAGRRTPGSLNDSEILCRALYLYLLADDMNQVNMLITKYDSGLSRSTSTLASLVQFGKNDLATRFFSAHWATLAQSWQNFGVPLYDDNMIKNFEDFSAKLNNKGESYVAEVMLAAVPDEERTANSAGFSSKSALALPTRDERLAELARRIKDISFTNGEHKAKAINALISSEKASSQLVEEIAAEYKKINVTEIAENNQSDVMELKSIILRRHIINSLLANDVQPFVETLEKLSKIQNQNYQYIFNRMGTPLLDACNEEIRKKKMHWTMDQSRKVAALLRTLLNNQLNNIYGDRHSFVSLLLAAHVQAGQPYELVQCFQELPQNVQLMYDMPNSSMDVFAFVRKAGADSDQESMEQRMGYVRDYLQIALKTPWFDWHPQQPGCMRGNNTPIFDLVIKSNLITKDELIENGPVLVWQFDDGGQTKAALAAWLMKQADANEAAALWNDAITSPGNTLRQKDYWRWSLTRSLIKLKKYEEARTVLYEIDVNTIDQTHRKEFEKFRSDIILSDKPIINQSK